MLSSIIPIAAGGASGAVLRHVSNQGVASILGASFPYGTMAVNIAGSFAMGLLIGIFSHIWQAPQEIKLFLTTGLLGGFTTFSAFSLDAVLLYERGAWISAGFYVSASVLGALAALVAGLTIIRWVAG